MNVKDAYKTWSGQYDTNVNKTRDLEAVSLRTTLTSCKVENCLEIGCGTGKNTEWLITLANHITAVDFSEEMLEKAEVKISSDRVRFHNADINDKWDFVKGQYDLITFSLVLEHIENLDLIFEKAARVSSPGGLIYIGELHPFKQYTGSKARFETEDGLQVVQCFTHNISDFTRAAGQNQFELVELNEFFDNDDRSIVPRILTLLLRKK